MQGLRKSAKRIRRTVKCARNLWYASAENVLDTWAVLYAIEEISIEEGHQEIAEVINMPRRRLRHHYDDWAREERNGDMDTVCVTGRTIRDAYVRFVREQCDEITAGLDAIIRG